MTALDASATARCVLELAAAGQADDHDDQDDQHQQDHEL
jgi:hypothetical protein